MYIFILCNYVLLELWFSNH